MAAATAMRDVLGGTDHRRVRRRLAVRVGVLIVLATMAASIPSVGDQRFTLAFVLLALAPLSVLAVLVAPPHLTGTLPILFDVAAAAVATLIVPSIWVAALLVVAVSPAASASVLGRTAYIATEMVGLGAIVLAVVLAGVDDWYIPVAVTFILVLAVASYAEVFLNQELSAVAQLEHVADSADLIFWEVGWDSGELTAVTGRVKEILGYAPTQIPRRLAEFLHTDDLPRLVDPVFKGGQREHQLTARVKHANGSWVWMRMSYRVVDAGGVLTVRGVAVDITELLELAEHDELTGLANRSVFNRALHEALEGSEPVALLLMDLDRFKEVNDTLGHHSGDQYLRTIAERLQRVVGNHLVARLGGDEFAIVATGRRAVRRATEIAARANAACEQPVNVDGLEFAGSASIGISMAPIHGDDAAELLRCADIAMYAAKRAGVGHRVYRADTQGATVDRLTLSSEVHGALSRGELRLWYQPKVDLASGRIVGAEGLLRWHHPERGILRPKDFLDVVEISRHYPALTNELVRQAVETMRLAQVGPDLRLAVNVSVRSLADPSFSAHVIDVLRSAHVDAECLILEITEREIMTERADIAAASTALRELGVQFSIDDFGTGHSSLLRLHELPITELKIDRRFIAGLGSGDDEPIIVRAIVDLAHRLGLNVVAEGVEAHYELEVLRELGCHEGQGFLWSEAVERADFLSMVYGARPTSALDAD